MNRYWRKRDLSKVIAVHLECEMNKDNWEEITKEEFLKFREEQENVNKGQK